VTSGDDHQVLQFRPRGRRAGFVPNGGPKPQEFEDLPEDLSRFESRDDEPDDFRHRMIMNAVAFVAALILIAAGVWLAIAMTDLRKKEDCLLMARRDCGTITPQHRG
jgi:hypothetical protein